MARAKTTYRCRDCGAQAPQWTGWCPACEGSGTLEEHELPADGGEDRSRGGGGSRRALDGGRAEAVPIADALQGQLAPVATGLPEVDRVLGGGLVPGSVTLVGGEPGIGKSTLLLQVVAALAGRGQRCGYVAAEESAQQVAARAERLGATGPGVWLVAETSLPRALDAVDAVEPDVLVVDSIQALVDPSSGSAAGSLAQVRGCAQLLVDEAKRRQLTVIMVGQVTKDGGLAGPKVLEHVVDTVLSFEGERHHALRLLRASKHRFGGTHELGLFEMSEAGLVGVPDPSALFLADRHLGIAGSVVAPVLDGQRPLLIEVQALVVPTQAPLPRRTVQGVEGGRLNQVLAVLERRVGLTVSRCDVHVAVAGGVRVREPGADLAVAVAVASAYADTPLMTDLVVCGEVGLGGEIRQVQRTDRRLGEAARLGFGLAIAPASAPEPSDTGLSLTRVRTLDAALASAGLSFAGERPNTVG